jgi:hypothetical protein
MFDRACLAAFLILAAGCGSHEPGGGEPAATTGGVAEGAVGAGPGPDAGGDAGGDAPAGDSFAFTAADLDAYARGIARETELARAAQQRALDAATPGERAAAAQAGWEDQTAPEAARQLGLDPERYRRTRDAVHEVLRTLDFQGKIDGPLSIDLSRVDEATRTRLSRDPFADLPPASAAALRERLPQLVPLWSEYTTLTAVAG